MKKCLSCIKDLPDAALHCVFCGAKQPPAPASQPAKTAFGYSAGEEMDKLRAQAASANAARVAPPASSPPANLPAAAPYSHQLAPNPMAATLPAAPPSPLAAPAPNLGGGYAPVAAANARTIAVAPGQGPMPIVGSRPHSPSQSPPIAGAYSPDGGLARPPDLSKVGPLEPVGYDAQPVDDPYSETERPMEPWKNSLRLVMYVWGALILVAFATPLSLDPLVFNWDAISNGDGAEKLGPLVIAAIGLLSIVVGAIPMGSGARGMIAALLGLSGFFIPVVTPLVQGGDFQWQPLVPMVGSLMVIAGLVIRSQYTSSFAPRFMVTNGVVGMLFLELVPLDGGAPPIVRMLDQLSGDGAMIVMTIVSLLAVVLAVYALIAVWLPSPRTAGVTLVAWLFILWPLFATAAAIFLLGNPEDITDHPSSATMWMIASGFFALIGYGTASFVGKSLEKP